MPRYGDHNGFYEFNNFPGCNQIVVSNHAYIYPEKRGRGIGTDYNNLRIKQAKILGYDYMICTVVSTNKPQLAILKKNGFKELDMFANKETGNAVKIFGRKLND
jgi:L-amino acid N-acyltransferase YncA